MSVVGDRAKLEAMKMQRYAEKRAERAAQAKQDSAQEARQLTKTDPSLSM